MEPLHQTSAVHTSGVDGFPKRKRYARKQTFDADIAKKITGSSAKLRRLAPRPVPVSAMYAAVALTPRVSSPKIYPKQLQFNLNPIMMDPPEPFTTVDQENEGSKAGTASRPKRRHVEGLGVMVM